MNKQETKLYFYIGCSQMYDTLHGMWEGNIEECTYDAAITFAREAALDVINDYNCILESIHEDANEEFGLEDTPLTPDEDYLDYIEERMEEEISITVYEVTQEGENHIDEMEEDMLDYTRYLENGWLKDCD